MKIEDLKTAIEAYKKYEFVNSFIANLDDDGCISVGGERLDKFVDIHESCKSALLGVLRIESSNLYKKIMNI